MCACTTINITPASEQRLRLKLRTLVIVYVPHTVEYTPAVQFSSLEYVTVPVNEMATEDDGTDCVKSIATIPPETVLRNTTQEKLMQHIMKDDLLLLNSAGKLNRRDLPLLLAKPDDSVSENNDDRPVFDFEINATDYQCEICDERFTMKKLLREHHATKHPGQNCNKCAVCEKTFKLRSNLRQHLRIHTGERPFRCDVCCKTFVQGSALTVHRELHKEQRDYECPVCKKAFKSKFAFKKHEKVHIGLRPFKCDECGKSFTQSCNLKAHQKLHTGNHAYQCATCSKTFRFKSHYQDHLMTHTKEKKYCCGQCGRTFAYKNSYQRHAQIHRDEAQHHCTECGKQFSKLSHLTFHHKSHACTRAVALVARDGDTASASKNICASVFERPDSLVAHRRELHDAEEGVREKGRCRYKCVICSKSFREEKELRTHFKLHEADDCPFQCGMCGILNLNPISN
uniref:C2H2-type domain-containing protein n=1 Tax=Anopheles culicifacies TaxID=139723 RepID=A0A182LS37_9DIPT